MTDNETKYKEIQGLIVDILSRIWRKKNAKLLEINTYPDDTYSVRYKGVLVWFTLIEKDKSKFTEVTVGGVSMETDENAFSIIEKKYRTQELDRLEVVLKKALK